MVNQKFYSTIRYLLFLALLVCCSGKVKLNPNSSFGYQDLTDSYSSKTDIFERRYADDTIKINITLTEVEKEKILKAFSENKFQRFPREIDCSRWGFYPQIYDEIFLDNYFVKYIHNRHDRLLCPSGKKFNKIKTIIQNIVLNKPEIKTLEPSNIAYE